MRVKIFISILYFLFSTGLSGQEEDKNAKLVEASFDLEFYMYEDELEAKLSVRKEYQSLKSLEHNISETVLYDNNSAVINIKRNDKKKIKPIVSDYESEGIFHSDLKLVYFDYKIEGKANLVLSYDKVFIDVYYLDPLYFVSLYDADVVNISITQPDWLDLNIVEWNFDGQQISKDVSKKENTTVISYVMKDVKAYSKQEDAPNRSMVYPHLIFNPRSYTLKGEEIFLLEDVGGLYYWYASLLEDVGDNTAPLVPIVEELIANKKTDEEKIKAIYYWVQDNIRYIAFEYGIMGFRPEACQSVLSNKYGDCKGMANLAKNMLQIAGFDARLTWIGTNDLPYDYSLPSLIVDNHMICTIIDGEKKIFIDPTEKFSNLYEYASRIQGKQVLIEDGDNFIVDVVPVNLELNKEVINQNFAVNNDVLYGEGSLVLTGGRSNSLKYYTKSIPEKDKLDFISYIINNGNKNIHTQLSSDLKLYERDKELRIKYKLEVENQIVNLGNELYINTETDYNFSNYKQLNDRTIPFKFDDVVQFLNSTTIEIPEGWKLSYLPEAINVENDAYTVSLSYSQKNGLINYNKHLAIKRQILEVSEFEAWNNTLKKLDDFYSDQIILEKI